MSLPDSDAAEKGEYAAVNRRAEGRKECQKLKRVGSHIPSCFSAHYLKEKKRKKRSQILQNLQDITTSMLYMPMTYKISLLYSLVPFPRYDHLFAKIYRDNNHAHASTWQLTWSIPIPNLKCLASLVCFRDIIGVAKFKWVTWPCPRLSGGCLPFPRLVSTY